MVCTSVLPAPSIASCRRLRTSWPMLRPPRAGAVRQRRGHVLEAVDAGDLLDEVDLARHVERAPGRRAGAAAVPPLDVEAEPVEDRAALLRAHVDARHRQHAPRAQVIQAGSGRSPCTSIGSGGERRARDLDEQPRGRAVRDRGERAGRRPSRSGSRPPCAGPMRRRRAHDEPRSNDAASSTTSRGLVVDLGVRAAHDARRCPTGRRRRRSRASRGRARAPCRRACVSCSPGAGPARDELVPGDAGEVVGVQRAVRGRAAT